MKEVLEHEQPQISFSQILPQSNQKTLKGKIQCLEGVNPRLEILNVHLQVYSKILSKMHSNLRLLLQEVSRLCSS